MTGRPFRGTRVSLRLAACAVSALYFAFLQLAPGFSQVHASLLHILDLPLGGDRSFAGNVADPGDLIALATAPLAAIYLSRAGGELEQASPLRQAEAHPFSAA